MATEENKTTNTEGAKKDLPRTWLDIVSGQVHDTKNNYRKRVNVGLAQSDGSVKRGYIFVNAHNIFEPERLKQINANKEDDKKLYTLCVYDDYTYPFTQGFGESRVVTEMSGLDIANQYKAYRGLSREQRMAGREKASGDASVSTPEATSAAKGDDSKKSMKAKSTTAKDVDDFDLPF